MTKTELRDRLGILREVVVGFSVEPMFNAKPMLKVIDDILNDLGECRDGCYCAFCGSPGYELHERNGNWYVDCRDPDCVKETNLFDTPEEAVAEWMKDKPKEVEI